MSSLKETADSATTPPGEILSMLYTKIHKIKAKLVPAQRIFNEIAIKAKCKPSRVRQLYMRHKKIAPATIKFHGHAKLTLAEEVALVCYLHRQGYESQHVYVAAIRQLVKTMFNKDVGDKFGYAFVKRHAYALLPSKNKTTEKGRVDPKIVELTQVFVQEYGRKYDDFNLGERPGAHLTCDETLLNITDGKLTTTRIKSKNASGEPIDIRPGLYGALLVFVSADGVFWMAAVCIKHSQSSKSNGPVAPTIPRNARTTNSPLLVKMFTSETGFFSGEHYSECLRDLENLFKEMGCSNSMKTLVADNCGIHRPEKNVLAHYDSYLDLFFLPPNTTAFTAPLDDILFASFKQTIASTYRKQWAALAAINKEDYAKKYGIASLLFECLAATFTKHAIKKAFRNVGLQPFDGDKIVERALKVVGKAEEEDEPDPVDRMVVKRFRDAQDNLRAQGERAFDKMKKQIEKSPANKNAKDAQRGGRKTIANCYLAGRLVTPENILQRAQSNEQLAPAPKKTKIAKKVDQVETNKENGEVKGIWNSVASSIASIFKQ